MNSTKKNIQKTSGIHRLGKFYKPGQREWCKYCINGFYCKLVKNIRVELHQP